MKWLIIFSILLTGAALRGQHGPYSIFELPESEAWSSFAGPQTLRQILPTFVWQPDSPTPLQGIILSPEGLALLPSTALGSMPAGQSAWLSDQPNGEELKLPGAGRLAILTGIEDVSEQVLQGISDTLSPAARAVKVANRLLLLRQKSTRHSEGSDIRPFYLGNRYHRYKWQYVEARLLGRVCGPDGFPFALVRLSPPAGSKDFTFSKLPRSDRQEQDLAPRFLCGLQIYPAEVLPSAGLRLYYTQLLPLLQEVQLILAANWEGRVNRPDWLDQLENATEAEMPLQPFADPALSASSCQQQTDSLLHALQPDREEWWKYQQIQQRLETGYEDIAPYLIARELALEIIPSRLQLFRLTRLLRQWEKTMDATPAMPPRLAASLDRFLDHFYAQFDAAADQQVAQQLFALYLDRTRHDLQSPFAIDQWAQAEKDPAVMAAALYLKSELTDAEEVRKALREDPAAFFQELKNDYAYRFVENWEQEHGERISKPLAKREATLREEQRRMIAGRLRHVPQQTSVEKGGLSFIQLPPVTLSEVSPHFLGNYAEGSAVLSARGQLLGITYVEGGQTLSHGRPGNRVMNIDFLNILKTEFPQHAITKEIFGLP